MSQNQAFCPSCGAAVSSGAQFCQTCGKPISTGLRCPQCGSAHSPSARFCRVCGTPIGAAGVPPGGVPQPAAPPRGLPLATPPAVPPPMPRPGAAPIPARKGSPTLPFVFGGLALVCICLVCGIGGLAIMIPPGSGGGTGQDLKLTPLVSQPLKPSSEAQTVSYEDKVRVTVPGGLLKSEQTLTISAVGNPPPMKIPAFEVGTIYDIALGNQHEFDQPITIEMAYDAKRLSPDMTAADQVRLAHWAPETQMWTLLPTAVDATRNVAIIRTSRLCGIGDAYKARGYHIWVSEDGLDRFPHFRIIYNPNLNVALEFPEHRPGTFDYQNKMVKVLNIEKYAEYVGNEIERAYKAYNDLGMIQFKQDEKIDVIIDNVTTIWGYQGADQAHPFYGAIFIRHDHGKISDLQFVAAHELFHIKQLRDVGPGTLSPPKLTNSDDPMTWFTDASADYAAGRIVWDRDKETGRTMGIDINARFLQASLRYNVAGNDNDPHSGHMYSASHFLDYLINGRPTLGSPKPANPTQRDINQRFVQIWGEMMSWKTKKGSIDALGVLRQWAGGSFDFDSAFEDFAAYFLFNVNSPMPGKPKKVPDKARSGNVCGLLLKDSQSTCDSIKIKGWYSAGLWDVAVEVDPTKQPRTVTVEPVEDVSDVIVKVYVLPKNERQNLGPWGSPKPKCQATKKAPCVVSLTSDDNVLYVVATNRGSQDREVTVKVSSSEVKPTITPKPLVPCKCICPGGWPLVQFPGDFLLGPLCPPDPPPPEPAYGTCKWEECYDEWEKKCGCPPRSDPTASACMASCCFRP